MASIEELESQAKAAFEAGNREQAMQLAKQAFDMRKANQETSYADYGKDIVRGGVRGAIEGVEGIAGMPGEVEAMGGFNPLNPLSSMTRIGGNIARSAGMMDRDTRLPFEGASMPTTEQIRGARQQAIGDIAPPTTRPGEVAQTIGRNLPNAMMPGGAIQRTANVLAPALGEEAGAGIARTFAPTWEDEARTAGALYGAWKSGSPPKRAPISPATKRAEATEKFTKFAQSGTKVANTGTAKLINAIDDAAKNAGLNPNIEGHRNMLQRIEEIKKIGMVDTSVPAKTIQPKRFTGTARTIPAKPGPRVAQKVNIDELRAIRDKLSQGYIQGADDNNRILGEVKRAFDNAVDNLKVSDFAAPGGKVGKEAFKEWQGARKLWSQYRTSERFEQIHENAMNSLANRTAQEPTTAYMTSVKQQLRSLARDDFKRAKYLSKEERDWVKKVIRSAPSEIDDPSEIAGIEQKLRNFGKRFGGTGKGSLVSGLGTFGGLAAAGADYGTAAMAGALSVKAGNAANELADTASKRTWDSLRNISAGGRPLPSITSDRLEQLGRAGIKTLPSTYDRNQR